MNDTNLFDYFSALIEACQKDKNQPRIYAPTGYDYCLEGAYYLLNQSIRQLAFRKGHRCVSKAAFTLWNNLQVRQPIFNYWYQKPVCYNNSEPVTVSFYRGAGSEPFLRKEIKFEGKNSCFPFRQVFHVEHVVPVNVILNQLLNVNLSDNKEKVYENIHTVLDKIYLCYMTKEEDRRLNKIAKTRRSDNFAEVIAKEYRDAGIEIALWQ